MASQMENHPIALIQALACGTYAVAPDIGRIRSIMSSGTGRIYNDNTVEGLIKALRKTIASEEYLSSKRSERATTFDGWEANAREIMELYKSINCE